MRTGRERADHLHRGLGIVYQTDAHAEPAVKVIGTFPSDTHEPIVYPIGITAGSKNADADAEAFVKFVQSAKAKQLFEAEGFTFLVAPVSN
jgi:molybdate transport system substrate-binding protein